MNKQKKSFSILKTYGTRILIAAGILLLAIIYGVMTMVDVHEVQTLTQETLSFAVKNITLIQQDEAEHRMEAQMTLLDKAHSLQQLLEKDTDTDALPTYLAEQHVAGIILLDSTLQPEYAWDDSGISAQTWQDIYTAEDMRQILQYPQKSVLRSVSLGTSQYDYTVTARTDAPGLMLLYRRRVGTETQDRMDEIIELLTQFSIQKNGALMFFNDGPSMPGTQFDLETVPTDEELNAESDDIQFIEMDAEDFFSCDFTTRHFGLLRASLMGKTFYGDAVHINGYTVCVFFPYASVFQSRELVLICVVLVYLFLLWLFGNVRSREQEKSLSLTNKQYRIIEALGQAFSTILLVDIADNKIEMISAPSYFSDELQGTGPADATLNRWAETYVTPAFAEKHKQFLDFSTVQERMAGNSHIDFNYQMKNGTWCQVMMLPKRVNGSGTIESVLLATRDISEEIRRDLEVNERLRQTADEARRANAAKTDFLRRMSHDIRTPINGIRGMIEIADHFPTDYEKQADCRRKIWQASDFLLDLVNNVLDMNKLESGELIIEEVPFSLREISKDVAAIIRPQASEAGVTLHTGWLHFEHDRLIGSRLYLRQILLNLAGNAVKYNRSGGSITVTCDEENCTGTSATYRFTVQDTGLGMSEEFQQHLFEPFAQENAAPHSTYTGTGLGLAITKELVEKMGGSITFISKQGQGTTFTVLLPFKIDTDYQENGEEALQSVTDLHGARALLVEDNDLNREIADFLLENEGIVVEDAADGKQAVEMFEKSAAGYYDFILMDVMMPVMDGLEATRIIRAMQRPDAAEVPIFAMTANAFADDIQRCREAGMTQHLSKPLDSDKLIRLLHKYRKV